MADSAGQSALLLGGFALPPVWLNRLRADLAGDGWRVRTAPLGNNTGCASDAVDKVIDHLEAWNGPGGVSLVGHSRGGLVARIVAIRRPDLVSRLVTVCTPWTLGPPDRPGVNIVAAAIGFVRARGVHVLESLECASGECCQALRADIDEVPRVPWVAIRARNDRITRGADKVPPSVAEVVVTTSHLGAVTSVAGRAAIIAALRHP